MSKLLARLLDTPFLVADGAWGSTFMQAGLDPSREPADAWNLRHPERVSRLASAYAEHADLLTTNTFGANAMRLGALGLEAELRDVNKAGVTLARNAARTTSRTGHTILVGGAMGPARGPARPGAENVPLEGIFKTQAQYLAEAGVDFLLLETMTDLTEALVAIRAARAVCDLDVVCSFAFQETKPGVFQTWSGHAVEAALDAATLAGAAVVGANCVPASESSLHLLHTMRSSMGNAPLWFKPNAGQPEMGGNAYTSVRYPHPFAQAPLDAFLQTLESGVIGGCCGTTPSDIALLRELVGHYPPPPQTE